METCVPLTMSKRILMFLITLLLSPTVLAINWAEWWTYEGISGPSYWGLINPDWLLCDRGKYQSPVNVDPTRLLFDANLGPVKLTRKRINGSVMNTGRDIRMRVNDNVKIGITGGPLTYAYRLQYVSIHFGGTDTHGSEHRVNGTAFPLEIQFVAYNTDLFKDFHLALGSSFGIAIISLLGQIGDKTNSQLAKIIKETSRTRFQGQTSPVSGVLISDILPNRTNYMTYEGSMTLPGCEEGVTWIILNKPVYIAKSHIKLLRSLYKMKPGKDRRPLRDNFRPTMPLNSRTVRTNIPPVYLEMKICRQRQLTYKVNSSIKT